MHGKARLFSLAAAGVVTLGIVSFAVAGDLRGPPNVPDKKNFDARLNGFREVPSVSSTGYGDFEAKLVEDQKLHFVFRYAGLEGGTSLFAHIHFAQRSVNGGVVVFLCGGGTKPTACTNVAGTVEGDIVPSDLVGSTGATNQGIEPGSWEEFIRAMRAGHAYVNIHTTRWGGGEIRGQINNDNQDEFDK
jgi:hypothetical protein